MTAIEKKMLAFFEKNLDRLFLFCILISGFIIRYAKRKYISWDMEQCLLPWYYEIKALGGLKSLSVQTGDYGCLYQFLIAIMTYIPLEPVLLYKSLSCIFDYVLAFSVSELLSACGAVKRFDKVYNIAVGVVLFLPTVIMNSAIWGQCDSVYVSFCILAILFLNKKKYRNMYIMLGIAFAFKLQTIFIVPFFILYYLVKKDHSILGYLWTFLVFELSGLPAFLMGRGILAPFQIYFFQAKEYRHMWMNTWSFWQLAGDDYATFKTVAVSLTVIILAIVIYVYMKRGSGLETPEEMIAVAAWMVWTCVVFLPAMHERYAYLLDMLLVSLVFINRRYLFFGMAAIGGSVIGYSSSLYDLHVMSLEMNIIYLTFYFIYTGKMMENIRFGGRQNEENKQG